MGLKYSFRHLFYGKLFHKDRLYNLLKDLDARITALEEASSTTEEPSAGGDTENTTNGGNTENTTTGGDTTENTTTGGDTTEEPTEPSDNTPTEP